MLQKKNHYLDPKNERYIDGLEPILDLKTEIFHCPITSCNESFSQEKQLHLHIGDSHLKQELIYQEENDFKSTSPDTKLPLPSFLRDILLKNEKIDVKQDFSCNFCVKSFNDKRDLIKHESIHSDEVPYGCKFCAKQYAREDLLLMVNFDCCFWK